MLNHNHNFYEAFVSHVHYKFTRLLRVKVEKGFFLGFYTCTVGNLGVIDAKLLLGISKAVKTLRLISSLCFCRHLLIAEKRMD